ncbi:hypothetical protein GETHOR_09960 [Geothrix oryzae]|uniref:Uncharacterized protein n=1 Tax=Geothrix oryzae TaxID=2927975 RepID=A0ABM8DPM2_9BACT|nr:hypothetical protein [Geothrix oryzae]BDU68895.1 hypothetical protein GETHOR_09960 [Geothrix oryzae]
MRGPMLLLLLTPAVLLAQRPQVAPAEAFDRELKRNRFGTWLVLEDEGAAWGGVMRSALDEEPMVLLNLPLKVVAGGKKADALAATLRDRFGWSRGAHWALVDGKGRVQAEGAEVPTGAALGRAVDQAGLPSRTQELEAFLRQSPDRLDARAALIQVHLAVASRRTWKALGSAEPKPAEASGPVPVKPLGPEADLAIWGAAAHQLDALLRETDGAPLGGAQGFVFSNGIRRSAAEHSPSVVAVLNRHRGALEEKLRRQPEDSEAWQLWTVASQKCGGWPLQPLLATMTPLPGASAGQWPPWSVLEEYLKDAKSRGEWATIREVLEPRWAELREALLDDRRSAGGDAFPWNWILGPLVEAQIAQGDTGAADQVLNEAAEVISWPGLPAKARDLATRLNRPDLATRWGALTPKSR